jgi:hypothetical protein
LFPEVFDQLRARVLRPARLSRRELRASRVRIVAARPPSASGRTTTMPMGPDPWPFDPCVHGRVTGGATLLRPGGPSACPGHGGRGLTIRPTAVGAGVGRGVGRTVGWGVAMAVGDGVPCDAGVGVETTATIGPSDAAGELDGATDGAIDGSLDGSVDGSTEGPTGEVGSGVTVGAGETTGGGPTAIEDGLGVPGTFATSDGGRLGATNPAVSATVARMRFRSPMATTKRAR